MPEVVTQAVDKMIEFIETVGNRFLESWYQTHTGYISDLKSFGDRVESSAQTVARAQEGSTAALVGGDGGRNGVPKGAGRADARERAARS
jgi:hypothetical protein